jgi:hypothetical protein
MDNHYHLELVKLKTTNMSKIKQLKDKVRKMLSLYPETRNSDITLTIKIWKEYYPSKILWREKDNKEYVAITDLFELPREDNIKRLRAKIQNEEGKYLPTEWKIAEKRGIEQDKWHKAMAFNQYK